MMMIMDLCLFDKIVGNYKLIEIATLFGYDIRSILILMSLYSTIGHCNKGDYCWNEFN